MVSCPSLEWKESVASLKLVLFGIVTVTDASCSRHKRSWFRVDGCDLVATGDPESRTVRRADGLGLGVAAATAALVDCE
jgi:hypothetical protein